MNILGLSAFSHESACCLLRDGVLVAAAQEERFSRVKHDPRLPVSAFRFCLDAGGIGITDLDWASPPTDLHPVFGEVFSLRLRAAEPGPRAPNHLSIP